jgi:hypothetical protein
MARYCEDPNCVQGEMAGKTYRLTEPIQALCCNQFLPIGTIVKVYKYTSKNRLLIEVSQGWHKIKRSNLNRVGELISEN